MAALFQIVGCVLSSKHAPRRIDDFVALVRRERAVVTLKDARGATFVRFNAPDARLVTLACEAVLSPGASSLRFGFASGIKEPLQQGQDGLSVSHRSIAMASDLAAGARDGEVLVSPQLASLLVESGLSFLSKDVQLPDGRVVPACLLDLTVGVAEKSQPVGRPGVEGKVTDALIRIYQALMAQANEMTRKQADLEARLDAALSKTTPADGREVTEPGELEEEPETRRDRSQKSLQATQMMEERISVLQQTASDAERKLAEVLARHAEVESLRSVCDALTEEVQSRADAISHMLADISLKLEMLSEQRAVVDHVGEQLARLDFTVQEAQNTLRALQREREVAERVEQGIKSLRNRSGAGKLG